jgi:serine/threonine-protein kinase
LALLGKLFDLSGSSGETPRRIAGYELAEQIASGPMSVVWKGARGDGTQAAVKILTEHGGRIAEKLSVKLGKPWEGEKARILQHPHVVDTLDCGKTRGRYYIVMELLTGGSFAEHLRVRTPAVMARRLEILIAAANGLAYVHEKGIIHRDMCPKNLMFDREGEVKLIDFGVSILKSDRLKPTEVRTGRPSYLAPELIRHNRFNEQTDIYAFGVMLYEAFAGRRPFLADNRDELMNLHLRVDPVPPSHADHTVPPAVDRVVLRALAKQPQHRFPNMRHVITSLVGLRGAVV